MVLILKPDYRVAIVDGVVHYLAEPPGKGTIELLRDVLGWQAHYDCHRGAVELRAPCGGGCACETVGGGAIETTNATAPGQGR